MGKKLLWLAAVFAGVTVLALVKGAPVPMAVLLGGAFAVPLLVTLPMPAWAAPAHAILTLVAVLIWGPSESDQHVRNWFLLWLVVLASLLYADVRAWIDYRRRKRASQ